MKKIVKPYLLFIVLFISCATGDDSTKTKTLNGGDVIVDNGNSLLWKVEGENIKTAYFFGTMHMINTEYYNFSENLTKRVQNSDAVIMEIGGMPNPLKTFEMMQVDSGTVHDYFTKEQLIELLKYMKEEKGISPQEFDQTYGAMKPFFLMQTLTEDYFEVDAKSYDLTIMGIASEKELPLIGLETIEEQLGFFDKIPRAEMANMIMQSITEGDKEMDDTEKLMKYYSQEKVDKLLPLLQKQSPEFMEFADIFLYDRNKAWVPKLEKEMADKSCFVAVGAGHLFGDNGLLDLLEKKGYKVTAISSK